VDCRPFVTGKSDEQYSGSDPTLLEYQDATPAPLEQQFLQRGAVHMAPRADQIVQQVQALLDQQIKLTMSGAVSCLTNQQWREYNRREAQISSLLQELDAVNSPRTGGNKAHQENAASLSRYQRAS
jgi:hypothetical protein